MVNFTAKTQMILIHTSAGHNDCAVRILHLYIRTIRDLKHFPVIRINEADVDKARDLVTGLESVKIRKMEPNEK